MILKDLEEEYYLNLGNYAIGHSFDDFDDIFLFGLRFYACLCDSLGKTEMLEFSVVGNECKELFMSYYSPLIRAYSLEHVKISLECKFLLLLNEGKFSKSKVRRLYVFYVVLCHSFYGNKTVMLDNLEYIFELAHRFCSASSFDELAQIYGEGKEALECWS